MLIKTKEDIETIILDFIKTNDNDFLREYFFYMQGKTKIFITENDYLIKTAAISRKNDKYYIGFNSEFLAKNIKTKEDIIFIFLHEIFHNLNGDFFRELYDRNLKYYKLCNLVFDIKINSTIIRDYRKEGYHFLKRFYNKTEYVLNFLLSPVFDFKDIPDIYKNNKKQDEIIKYILKKRFKDEDKIKDKKNFARLYINAWFKDVSFEKLMKLLLNSIKMGKMKWFEIILLGSHRWRRFKNVFNEEKVIIDDYVDNGNINKILSAIKKALIEEGDKTIMDKCLTTKRSIVPVIGRREFMMLYKNVYPFFFPNIVEDIADAYRRVNLYIDVSGSMEDYLPFIYKLIDSVKMYINHTIYLMSSDIVAIMIDEFKKGIKKTGYGTSFNRLLEHAIENDFKKLLVITDGEGSIKYDLADEVKKRKIEIYEVLVDEKNEYMDGFKRIARQRWVLRNLK